MNFITRILLSVVALTTSTCAFTTFPQFHITTAATTTSTITTTSTNQPRPLYATSSSSSDGTKKYQKVFVAGGTKGVGRCIVDQLVAQGRQVVVLARNTEDCTALNAYSPQITAIPGDAFVIKDVEHAMDGCDAAITTLGGSTTDTGSRIDYEGNNHVIESAGILGVTRVVLVTSIGCGTSKAAAPPTVFDALKEVLLAKERAENILIKYYTNMNWTIIRPGGLKSEPGTGRAILTEDATTAIGSIHREDVAALVIQALDSPNTERKVLSAIDPSLLTSVGVAVEGAAPAPAAVTAFAL